MGAAFFCRSLIPLSRSLQKCKYEYEKILSQNIQHGKKNSEFDSEFVEKGCEMLKAIYYYRESDGKMFVTVCKSFQRLPFF
jgi:hypothetical protein